MGKWCLHATSSCLNKSSSKLQVTRTGIQAQMSLIFGQDQTAHWSYLPLSDDNFTLLKLNISEASRPVFIKFYLKHHWGWGGGRLHEVLEHWIKTLVSMAMERPH